MSESEACLWRTLLAVESVTEENVIIRIPGWGPDSVSLPLSTLPPALVPLLAPDYRFHARVNIGAELAEDLQFEAFEWEGTLEEQEAAIQAFKEEHGL